MAKASTSKASVPATRKAGTAVSKSSSKNVPAYLKNKEMSGRGADMDQSDLLIPMVRILQKMSPEVDKATASFIKGAEPGDIYIKNAPNPIIKGEEGFLFQPCFRRKAFVEWLPRNKGGGGGAGFVASHAEEPSDTEQATIAGPDGERQVRRRKSNGNLVVETRYYGGFIIRGEFDDDGNFEQHEPPMAAVIPFAGSGHTPAKTWNGLISSKRIGDGTADIWAVYYKLQTISKTKGPNTWSIFDIIDAGPEDEGFPTTLWAPTDEDFERGEGLYQSLATEQRRFDESQVGNEDAAGDTKGRPM